MAPRILKNSAFLLDCDMGVALIALVLLKLKPFLCLPEMMAHLWEATIVTLFLESLSTIASL